MAQLGRLRIKSIDFQVAYPFGEQATKAKARLSAEVKPLKSTLVSNSVRPSVLFFALDGAFTRGDLLLDILGLDDGGEFPDIISFSHPRFWYSSNVETIVLTDILEHVTDEKDRRFDPAFNMSAQVSAFGEWH